MAVDLTGKFLSASREVRIVTNLCVYWDEIYPGGERRAAARPADHGALAARPICISAASHARPSIRERKQPEPFDYQTVSFTSMWNPTPGNYTRYGDVQKLLAAARRPHGDHGLGRRDPPAVRARRGCRRCPPAGSAISCCWWTAGRRMPTPTRRSRRVVLPLPFHAMSSYPYPAGEHYPQDARTRSICASTTRARRCG